MRIAVIGGLAAGPAAAAEAARRAPDAQVVMYEAGPHISVGTCELPYALGGRLTPDADLVVVTPEEMKRSRGVDVFVHHRVTALDARTGTLTVDALEFGATREERFDRVILATGAKARRLEVDGEDAAGVFELRDLVDKEQIERWLETEPVRHVVVVGGGYVGLEAAEAMRDRGIRATILDPSGRVLNSTVACEASDLLNDAVLEAGVTVRPERVTEVVASGDGRVTAVRTDAGEIIGCQMVIASVGIEPRTELAKAAGLKLGSQGGLEVDDHMRTSSQRVWACGDVVEIPRAPDGQRVLWPLATTARRTARVAARNATSMTPADRFRPFAGSVAVLAFGIEVGSVGLSLSQAQDAGIDAVAADIRHKSRTGAFEDSKPIDVRLVVEKGSGRILGGQLVGAEGAALRANVLAPLVQSKATARELAEDIDLLYTPPLAPAVDPLKIAASRALHLT
ncbi:FAD-dependent oxidoreductase [Rubrivirga sp.]|uniref:FAD-dependent oxidoreductase n=1 Tax=Rubrivirga sp. TaxID=1885344 RepID=UPI003C79427E